MEKPTSTEEPGQELWQLLFPCLIFWALQHIRWSGNRHLFFLNRPKPWDFEKSPSELLHGSYQGARDRRLRVPWSKWLNKIEGVHVFCITKKNWYCYHVSLKQSFRLPTKVLFPRPWSQAAGDGFVCTGVGQVQPGLSPPALSSSASHTCSISSLFVLFPHSQLLCSFLLCRHRNLRRTAKWVMTSRSPHLCFGW